MSKQTNTIISNIHKNMMGTSSFDMKLPNMRKPQDFIVYPIQKGEDWEEINIQSDNRFGRLNLLTGKGIMSSTANYANSMHLALCEVRKQATEFEVTAQDLELLKTSIKGTASEKAGTNGVMFCDNSGASMTKLF
jgi:hypothetical protein